MLPVLPKSLHYLQRSKIGFLGEEIACAYLRKRHFQILHRNYKLRYGEIDIIAKNDKAYVFIEVKTRTNTLYGQPKDAITYKKLQELVKTAQYYQLKFLESNTPIRIDVISILLDPLTHQSLSLEHIPNITL